MKPFSLPIPILAMLLGCLPLSANAQFNVQDYGASGDSSQYAQAYIQEAIEACHAAGGGTVYFPPGGYKTGTIVLKDNVVLQLEAGATIWASLEEKDYENEFTIYKKNDSGKLSGEGTPVLIYARDADNIGITGKGKIHGRARRTYESLKQVDGFIAEETENARQAGVEMKMYYKVKPYTCMVFLEDCENVTIRDVSLIESTDWTLHFKWCRKVFVDGVYIASSLEKGVNADGIDIDGSQGSSKIEGFPGEQALENIRLYHIQLIMEAEDKPDKRATHGFYAHDVNGLVLSDFSVNWDGSKGIEEKWASAVALETVDGLEMDRVKGRHAYDGPAVSLKNVKNAYITNTLPEKGTRLLFDISGAGTQNLVFRDNDPLKQAIETFSVHEEVSKSTVKN